jgi:hypothetical protein
MANGNMNTLTKREEFAKAAMAGLLASPNLIRPVETVAVMNADRLIAELAKTEPKPAMPSSPWISVEDRMPEHKGTSALVCATHDIHGSDSPVRHYWTAYFDNGMWIDDVSDRELRNITHWQPIIPPEVKL